MRVRRYRSLLALAIIAVATGVASATPMLVLAGVIPLTYVLAGALGSSPDLADTVRVERDLDVESPLPGQPVTVTLTVKSVGDMPLPDVRAVDSVPPELGVTNGRARVSGPLRSGGQLSTTYTLVADRGTYEFGDVAVRGRNVTGTRLTDATVSAAGADDFTCRVAREDMPVRRDTTAYTGPLATDIGGPGVEFYATRDYRSGDPVRRIDWAQYAKTGDLSTVEYREQRAARVAVVIDSRPVAHVAPETTRPTGATLCAYAATLAVDVLTGDGHHVAVGALGVTDPTTGTGPPAWVPASETGSFAARAAAVCNSAATGADAAVSRTAAADGGTGGHQRLLARLPADAQVLLCTPALDDRMVGLVESLRSAGHTTTVLSPQVTAGTVGGRVVELERATRLDRLRSLDATVVDWNRDEQLPTALARTLDRGWQR